MGASVTSSSQPLQAADQESGTIRSGLRERTGAIVVHHRNFPVVLGTVERIIAGGIEPSRVVVVDNSEDPPLLNRLIEAVPTDVRVIAEANRGYGHAVNVAVRALEEQSLDFVVISTHEARPEPGAIDLLIRALDADATVGAVGPTLVTGEPGESVIWSMGGHCTRVLNEPRHFGAGEPWDAAVTQRPAARRHWVDGAFVAYRYGVLCEHPLREDFFLYFEETDLHQRLRDAGLAVLWIPAAVVWQSSGGAPPYLLARNLQRYQRAHGTLLQAVVTVPWVILRAGIRKAARGGRSHQRRDMLRGWRDA